MLVLHEHSEAVRCVDYCPTRPVLATGSQDRTVKLWDLTTGKVQHTFKHKASVEALAFIAGGELLVSGGADASVLAMKPTRADKRNSLEMVFEGANPPQAVRCLCSAPAGHRFATVDWAGTVRVWTDGKQTHDFQFDQAEGNATCAAFAGSSLFTASNQGVIAERDLGISRAPRQFRVPGPVFSLAGSVDGRLLAAGTAAGDIHLFDLETGKERALLKGHTWVVYGLRFTPDCRSLVSGSADGCVRIWDAAGFARTAYDWQHSWVNAIAVSPDGSTAAAACADGSLVLFDLD